MELIKEIEGASIEKGCKVKRGETEGKLRYRRVEIRGWWSQRIFELMGK